MATPEPRQIRAIATPASDLPGISVREAAARLGTSESDVRRRIKRGEVDAGYYDRPGGSLLRVFLDAPGATPDPPQPAPCDRTALAIVTPEPHRATPEPRQDTPAIVAAAVAPLVDRLAVADALMLASAEARQVQIETIARLRESLARSQSELSHASSRASEMAAQIVASDELLLANAETIVSQADQLAAQAEAIGRLTAELQHERARSWWDRLRGR